MKRWVFWSLFLGWAAGVLAVWACGMYLATRYLSHLQAILGELTATVDAQAEEVQVLRKMVQELEERWRSAKELAAKQHSDMTRRDYYYWRTGVPDSYYRSWAYGGEDYYSGEWGGALRRRRRRRAGRAAPPAPAPPVPAPPPRAWWPSYGGGAPDVWADLYYGPGGARALDPGRYGALREWSDALTGDLAASSPPLSPSKPDGVVPPRPFKPKPLSHIPPLGPVVSQESPVLSASPAGGDVAELAGATKAQDSYRLTWSSHGHDSL